MPNTLSSSCVRAARRLTLAGLLAAAAAVPLWPGSAGAVTRPAQPGDGTATTPSAAPTTGPTAGDAVPSTDEWMRAKKFIAAKSPNKWLMYENLPAEGKLKHQLRQQLVQRYRALQRMAQNDPERHALEERAIWIEDEIYGVLQDLDVTLKEGKDPARDEARLREKVGELVQNRDRWKAKRLERVARELRSIGGGSGGGHLSDAIKEVDAEMKRLLNLEPADRSQRVENRVKEFKQMMTGTKARSPLGRPLPGAESQPVDTPAPIEPAATPPAS